LDYRTEILLRTREEHKLSVKDAELLLLQVEELQTLLDKSEEENSYMKMQAKNVTEEVNQLKDENQKLQLQIQTEYEQQESREVPIAEVDSREKVPVQESGNHRGIPVSEEKLEDTGAERIRREADSASEIENAQKLPYDLHSKADRMEEENYRLRKEVETLRMENKKLYAMLTDWQGKDIGCALHLREKLLTLCEKIRSVAKELQDGDDKGNWKLEECVEKLDAMEKGGSDSTPLEKGKLTEYGRLVSGEMNVDSLQVRSSEVELAMVLVLMQHQERVKEVVMLQEAVETLRTTLRNYLDRITPQPSVLERPRSPSIQSRRSNPSTPERTGAKDIEETTDVIVAAKEILQEEYEALETRSIGGEDELRGLARLHINLGTRLHQVLMDEKLETELMGLKEERKKLREDLEARVEEVEKMEAELGALQKLLREGNEKQGSMDPRQEKQWAEKRRIAEKKVGSLSEELVLQRQQVSNMKETVLSWAEEQEAVTEELEEEVLDLVSKESAPTMDGWNDEHVEKLMEKMKSYKALTRRHSLDLQSVGKNLMRVSSTIEFTQRQLLVRPQEDGLEDDDDDDDEEDEGGTSVERSDVDFLKSEVSSSIGKDQKVRGFGISWFMLLCRAEKKAFLSTGNSSIKAKKKKLGCWN
jgi:chromosome segregation ATPase